MNLIKSVEVGYFRSIYKEKLTRLTDLTVLFGRNDCGKSNFLRALNLFFNDETNPDVVIDFYRDFCHARLSEVSNLSDARKRIYVKIEFNTPSNWKRSLGRSFYVKKSWSVSRGTEFKLDSSLDDSKRQFLTRFLNKIKFYYIPAIKDRRIFEVLLANVYNVISSHEEFRDSLDNFTTELQKKTSEISNDLHTKLGITSAIAPPTDLTDLFRSLDFETGNSYGGKHSLTLQRGDGIQVRHIPTILSFLSDKGSYDFNIWGFEEPENSLELANAVDEADALLKFSNSDNIQIFVTSHSPAFFNIENEATQRFFVSKSKNEALDAESSSIELISREKYPGDLMGETPLLPLISSYLKNAHQEIEKLKQDGKLLNELLIQKSTPIIFVEGESDKIIIQHAWTLFGNPSIQIDIESCSGTTKMKSLSQDGRVLCLLNPERRIFVLVDNDKEGRELSKADSKKLKPGGVWIQHKSRSLKESNGSYWCRLPFSDDFSNKMKDWKIPEMSWPYALENCFSQELHNEAITAGVLRFETMPHDELLHCDVSKKIAVPLASSDQHTYLRAPDKDYKVSFAEWIVEQSATRIDLMLPFKRTVEGIVESLTQATD